MKVYLGGPIDPSDEGILSHCLKWREHAREKLALCGITSINPMRGGIHPAAGEKLDSIPAPPKSIVTRDLCDLGQADLMLVYWPENTDKRGIGTLMEIAIAWNNFTPILLIDPGCKVTDHPWIQTCVTETHETLADALATIRDYWRDN